MDVVVVLAVVGLILLLAVALRWASPELPRDIRYRHSGHPNGGRADHVPGFDPPGGHEPR